MARLLLYTRTTGYRHESIPAGIGALRGMNGFSVDATEDPAVFRPRLLRDYAVVVFLSTSGEVLDEAGREALAGYLAAGGAWLGIHGASTTEYDWPWFGDLAGARFDRHPPVQSGVLTVADEHHPATERLPSAWTRCDEWYAFTDNPRPRVRVLLTVDETSYQGGTMGADHPVAWCHERLGGRSLYTALGHTSESFAEPAFLRHLSGALSWLTGRALPAARRVPRIPGRVQAPAGRRARKPGDGGYLSTLGGGRVSVIPPCGAGRCPAPLAPRLFTPPYEDRDAVQVPVPNGAGGPSA